jgi:YihY family inner membrane protein
MRIIVEKPEPLATQLFREGRVRRWRPTIQYLSQTEVHVYALAIAASVLLSFVPFLVVVLTLVREVFHSVPAERAMFLAIHDYFPRDLGDTISNGIRQNMNKASHGRFQITSVILLFFTANGVFEPLEVALNRAWGVAKNRSYVKNQLLSFFLILLCGGLVLGSLLLTANSGNYVKTALHLSAFPDWLSVAVFKAAAIPVTIMALFLTYWILPNRRVPVRRILPVAVMVGLALEVLKYAFLRAWPWLSVKFRNEYSPFQHSVSIIVLSMVTSLLILAGAEWSARKPEGETIAQVGELPAGD